MLASLDDVNTHLPEDKLVAEDTTVDLFQIDVERTVRGYLSGVFSPTTLAAWDDPDSTPGTIRAIAGRLIAAAFYAQRYAEDLTEVPEYAQKLYDEGMRMLIGVQTGALVLEEVPDDLETLGRLTSADFWPNDTTEGPLFKVSDEYA